MFGKHMGFRYRDPYPWEPGYISHRREERESKKAFQDYEAGAREREQKWQALEHERKRKECVEENLEHERKRKEREERERYLNELRERDKYSSALISERMRTLETPLPRMASDAFDFEFVAAQWLWSWGMMTFM